MLAHSSLRNSWRSCSVLLFDQDVPKHLSKGCSIHDKSGEIAGLTILFLWRKDFVYVTLTIQVSINEDQICLRSCWDPGPYHGYVTIFSPHCNLELPRTWHILKQPCSPVSLSYSVNGLIACLEPSRYFPVRNKHVSSLGLEPSRLHLVYGIAPSQTSCYWICCA